MRSPDVFLVGAPKCGTTSLADYLKQHPEVFVPAKKELNYFGADLRILNRPRLTLDEYLAFYAEAGDEKRAVDASVWSLYSRVAAAEIRDFCPTARIIVMLRDPVDMMYALHAHNLYTGNENIRDFAAALEAEGPRQRGQRLEGRRDRVVDLLRYRDAARYAEQIERYVGAFGQSAVQVILFEDFARDTDGVFRQVCEFLDVNPEFRPDFRVVNANKRLRSRLVVDLLRYTAPPVHSGPQSWPERAWRGLRTRIRNWNIASYTPRRPMDPALRRRLQDELRPEVERLGTLIGRDLSHWCRS